MAGELVTDKLLQDGFCLTDVLCDLLVDPWTYPLLNQPLKTGGGGGGGIFNNMTFNPVYTVLIQIQPRLTQPTSIGGLELGSRLKVS